MFWANEGGPALFRFAGELMNKGSSILFDDACLADARVFADAAP